MNEFKKKMAGIIKDSHMYLGIAVETAYAIGLLIIGFLICLILQVLI